MDGINYISMGFQVLTTEEHPTYPLKNVIKKKILIRKENGKQSVTFRNEIQHHLRILIFFFFLQMIIIRIASNDTLIMVCITS